MEFSTYRWREHCGPNYDNDIGYRTEEEYLQWKEKDPIPAFETQLLHELVMSSADIKKMNSVIEQKVVEAFKFAEESPFPQSEEAPSYLCRRDFVSRQILFTQALNEALKLALEQDSKVLCYGLGVDDPKRVFGTTVGLQEQFGKQRVLICRLLKMR